MAKVVELPLVKVGNRKNGFRSPYDEAAALGRMDPVALSSTLLRSSRIFSGSGKTCVHNSP